MIDPLLVSQQFLNLLGTRMHCYYGDRIPHEGAVLVVSNHRSFMDAPLLMAALERPIRFACHPYMGRVPVMREMVNQLGAFPLDVPPQRQQRFFYQATQFLQTQQTVGIFPEGAEPMVQNTAPNSIGNFHRGFAHLALRVPVRELAVLPVAIASESETNSPFFPVRLLSLFDPTEPLFRLPTWHPMIIYHRVQVRVGHPIFISPLKQREYQGKQARMAVRELGDRCYEEIVELLKT